MSHDCPKCEHSFETEVKLNTHILLNHPSLARSRCEDFEAPVSEGHLEEPDIEKGERFGYR